MRETLSPRLSALFDSYPLGPGHKAPTGPSVEAARAVKQPAKILRARVLEVLRQHPDGRTTDEVAAELGASVLAIRPRFSELNAAGEIEATNLRRRNSSGLSATVWRVLRNERSSEPSTGGENLDDLDFGRSL